MISKENTSTLSDGDSNANAGNEVAEKVVDFLDPLLPVFLEAAVNEVVRIMDGKAVFNFAALEGPKQKIRAVQEKLKADTQLEKAKLVEYCGIVLGSVKELSTFEIHGESKTDKGARWKKMNKP